MCKMLSETKPVTSQCFSTYLRINYQLNKYFHDTCMNDVIVGELFPSDHTYTCMCDFIRKNAMSRIFLKMAARGYRCDVMCERHQLFPSNHTYTCRSDVIRKNVMSRFSLKMAARGYRCDVMCERHQFLYTRPGVRIWFLKKILEFFSYFLA